MSKADDVYYFGVQSSMETDAGRAETMFALLSKCAVLVSSYPSYCMH